MQKVKTLKQIAKQVTAEKVVLVCLSEHITSIRTLTTCTGCDEQELCRKLWKALSGRSY